jgi:hypothetical protein
VLSNLLNSGRFARLVEQKAVDGPTAYAPAEFLADVRKGVWKELDGSSVRIDAYRRNLQRAYLDLANAKVNSTATVPVGLPPEFAGQFATSGDEKGLYRAELRSLHSSIASALMKASDRDTKAHLEAARDQIARILDPKFAAVGGAGAGAIIRLGLEGVDQLDSCWPDYVIRP